MIQRLWAENYKSLRRFGLELRPFNVLVGANGAGKTNVIDALRFIHDSVFFQNGVAGAVSKRAGWRGVAADPKAGATTKIGLTLTLPEPLVYRAISSDPGRAKSVNFGQLVDYSLSVRSSSGRIRVDSEILSQAGHQNTIDRSGLLYDREDNDAAGWPGNAPIDLMMMNLSDSWRSNLPILSYPIESVRPVADQIFEWTFLDLDVNEARQLAADTSVESDVSAGTSSLPIILDSLRGSTRELVRDAMRRDVEGFRDFHVRRLGGKIFFTVDEINAKDLPPESISDGTIRLLYIYSLYYSQEWPSLLCIEEPEVGLHPQLIETLVEYLRALSEHTQVIITTHSPLLVDQCQPEEVVLLDKTNGATRAMRVPERSQIEQFLQDFSLGELWTQDFLDEIVHNGVGNHSTG